MGAYLIELKLNGVLHQDDANLITGGMIVYLAICVLARLQTDQQRVLRFVGDLTFKQTLAIFGTPWFLALSIHDAEFTLSTYCLLGLTLTSITCFILPLYLW
jgi:hypothetical protein